MRIASLTSVVLLSTLIAAGTSRAGPAETSGTAPGALPSFKTDVRYHRHHEHDEDSERGRKCEDFVDETGEQRPSEGWARRLAKKAWSQKVRFKYGELYIDLDNARDVQITCSHSSIGSFMRRCEVHARPCKAVSETEHHGHDHDHD